MWPVLHCHPDSFCVLLCTFFIKWGHRYLIDWLEGWTFCVQLQGRRVARVAAGVGAMGLTRRRPQYALFHVSFLPVACQLVKWYWSEISLQVSLYNNQDLNFYKLLWHIRYKSIKFSSICEVCSHPMTLFSKVAFDTPMNCFSSYMLVLLLQRSLSLQCIAWRLIVCIQEQMNSEMILHFPYCLWHCVEADNIVQQFLAFLTKIPETFWRFNNLALTYNN
jgi:hypothetical protein